MDANVERLKDLLMKGKDVLDKALYSGEKRDIYFYLQKIEEVASYVNTAGRIADTLAFHNERPKEPWQE